MPAVDPDLPLRQAAVAQARQLAEVYDDLVPLARLREGFEFGGERVSFGSFQRGIHRGRYQRGPAALSLTTSFKDPYADTFDEVGALFTYAYRAGSIDQPDNRALHRHAATHGGPPGPEAAQVTVRAVRARSGMIVRADAALRDVTARPGATPRVDELARFPRFADERQPRPRPRWLAEHGLRPVDRTSERHG